MGKPRSHCPACGQGPLGRLSRDRVLCPGGCITDGIGYQYLHDLDPRPPEVEESARLDVSELFAPAYLGLVVEKGFPPLLVCVAQTAAQALEELRAACDLRRAEPVVIALWGCKAWEERGAA